MKLEIWSFSRSLSPRLPCKLLWNGFHFISLGSHLLLRHRPRAATHRPKRRRSLSRPNDASRASLLLVTDTTLSSPQLTFTLLGSSCAAVVTAVQRWNYLCIGKRYNMRGVNSLNARLSPRCSDCWGSWCWSSSLPCPQPDLSPQATCTDSCGSPTTGTERQVSNWTQRPIWSRNMNQNTNDSSKAFLKEINKALTASRFMMVWPVSPNRGFLNRTLNSGHG